MGECAGGCVGGRVAPGPGAREKRNEVGHGLVARPGTRPRRTRARARARARRGPARARSLSPLLSRPASLALPPPHLCPQPALPTRAHLGDAGLDQIGDGQVDEGHVGCGGEEEETRGSEKKTSAAVGALWRPADGGGTSRAARGPARRPAIHLPIPLAPSPRPTTSTHDGSRGPPASVQPPGRVSAEPLS